MFFWEKQPCWGKAPMVKKGATISRVTHAEGSGTIQRTKGEAAWRQKALASRNPGFKQNSRTIDFYSPAFGTHCRWGFKLLKNRHSPGLNSGPHRPNLVPTQALHHEGRYSPGGGCIPSTEAVQDNENEISRKVELCLEMHRDLG